MISMQTTLSTGAHNKHTREGLAHMATPSNGVTDTQFYRQLAILILPTLVFWCILITINEGFPDLFAGCNVWSSQPGTPTSTCSFIDVLERPNWFMVCGFFTATAFAAVSHRHDPKSLKRVTLVLGCAITLSIRCLSSFSGRQTMSSFTFLIFNSNSPGKSFWLWLLLELGFWNYTYLGTYTDYVYDEVSLCEVG